MSAPPLLTRAFVLCSIANLFQGLAFNLFLHFPGYLNELGARDVEIGFIWGITGFAAIVSRPPIGRAMDERGRRGVIVLGGALNVLVCALYLTVDSIGPWIYGLRVLHGLAEAMLFTALFTYAADCVPADRRTQGLALFGVSGMLPISFGALLGDAILVRAGYTEVFLAALALAALSLLLSLPLVDQPRGDAEGEPSRGFFAALRQRDLLPIWWIGSIFAIALTAVFTFLKRYVDDTGLGTVGGFFTAYAWTAIGLRVFLGWLPDRVGPKRVLFPALAMLALAFVVLALAEDARQVAVAGVCFGLGHGFTFPILFGILVSRASDADRGSAMAIFTALFDLGLVLGGPLFGGIREAQGFPAMFAAGALAVLVGSAIFALWDRAR